MDWISALSAAGDAMGGLGSIFGDSGDGSWQPYDNEVFNNWRNIQHGLRGDIKSGNVGVFGGQYGQEFLNNIRKMTSGEAAQGIGSAIQSQMAPQLSMQIDKLMSSLNPALRGSGIGAQMSKDVTRDANTGLADALAQLQGGFFQQGTQMLGQGQQMNLQALLQAFGQQNQAMLR